MSVYEMYESNRTYLGILQYSVHSEALHTSVLSACQNSESMSDVESRLELGEHPVGNPRLVEHATSVIRNPYESAHNSAPERQEWGREKAFTAR